MILQWNANFFQTVGYDPSVSCEISLVGHCQHYKIRIERKYQNVLEAVKQYFHESFVSDYVCIHTQVYMYTYLHVDVYRVRMSNAFLLLRVVEKPESHCFIYNKNAKQYYMFTDPTACLGVTNTNVDTTGRFLYPYASITLFKLL